MLDCFAVLRNLHHFFELRLIQAIPYWVILKTISNQSINTLFALRALTSFESPGHAFHRRPRILL